MPPVGRLHRRAPQAADRQALQKGPAGQVLGRVPQPHRVIPRQRQPMVYSYGSAAISTPEICPAGKTPEAPPTGSSPPTRASTYSVPLTTEPAVPDGVMVTGTTML